MPRQPMSWKWRLTIALVILILVSISFFFTPWGHSTMKGWVDQAYEGTPEQERVTSEVADKYLTLAWWTGNVCLQSKSSMEMYKDFLGIGGKDFWEKYKTQNKMAWSGKFDGKTKTGWGILHARAPEAYYSYLDIYGLDQSGSFIQMEAKHYYDLFYVIYPRVFKTGGKPHPKFYKYWNKISERMITPYHAMPPHVDPKPKDYEGPIP